MVLDNGPATPQRFGRYELVERLAVGGMAEIWRASAIGEQGFQKTVVIKRILPHLASDPEFVGMFIDEAKLQGVLDHPKIVQAIEFGRESGQYFMVLEYVDGLDVLALLRACAQRRQRLPYKLALYITSEMLDALAFAHERKGSDGATLGIIHRDISPSNVFLSKYGHVKLGDFGIARIAEPSRAPQTQPGQLKGKYGYMAPEQVVGGSMDHRADIFSVGVVLAEMLIGRRLFTAPNDLDVLLMVRDVKLERLDKYGNDLPRPLRALVQKFLSRDPADRFQTARAARDAIEEHLFDTRQRVSSNDLADFIARTIKESGPIASSSTTDNNLIGENTRNAHEAEARKLAAVRDAAQQPAVVQRAHEIEESGPISDGSSNSIIEITSLTPSVVRPDQKGSLLDTSAAKLFSGLATANETGLLVVQRGQILKEVFLVDGAPEFVASNSPAERFGEYLVKQGVLSPGELSMALAIMPQFNGKLGDTLVGLNLLRPLEVFRHLTRQVRDKIIDVFSWPDGTFEYYHGQRNPREAFPLGLDAFEIVGAAVATLPIEVIQPRLEAIGSHRPKRVETEKPKPEQFRVGAGPRELWQRLDGRRTVSEWMRRYEQPDQFLTLCRTLYLLLEAGLATLD